jgi:N-acetylglucosaminyldiphosphoundecaprenol N-acetyl-beta-D-mannosaminyltransferase
LKIVGIQDGYFNKTAGSAENEAVVRDINAAHPDILIVGLGMPLQEKWLLDNWNQMDAQVALPVGAMIDYLAHETRRAPRWMTDHGLEWLGRLVYEPGRLWERYLVGNPRFLLRVLVHRFQMNL